MTKYKGIEIEPTPVQISNVVNNINDAIGEDLEEYITTDQLKQYLIDSGILVETAIGLVESKPARRVGIHGQCISFLNETYYIVTYDMCGQRYLIDLVFDTIPELEQTDLAFDYSFRRYEELCRIYPDTVIVLEAEDHYWTYQTSAKFVVNYCGFTPYHNRDGRLGLRFPKDYLYFVVDCLEEDEISYMISGPYNEESCNFEDSAFEQAAAELTAAENEWRRNPVVDDGTLVTLKDKHGDLLKRLIVTTEGQNTRVTQGINGTIIFDPELSLDEIEEKLSSGSPLGKELMGKPVGYVTHSVPDEAYEIISIE